jgi:hypothetical protein
LVKRADFFAEEKREKQTTTNKRDYNKKQHFFPPGFIIIKHSCLPSLYSFNFLRASLFLCSRISLSVSGVLLIRVEICEGLPVPLSPISTSRSESEMC